MKRTAAKRKATAKSAAASQRAGADLEGLRQRITRLIASKAYGMVNATITEVNNKGNVPALKFLFEIIGLYPGASEPAEEVQDILARTLMRRLGLREEESATPEVTKDCEAAAAAGATANEDAVE